MKTLFLIIAAALQTTFAFSQSATELFIEIPEQGKISVYVDDEMISSSKNLFRFYDVQNPNPTVTILQNNKQIAKSKIEIRPNYRTFLSYSKRSGLQVVKTLPVIQNNTYALDDWDGVIGGSIGRPERPGAGRPTRPAIPAANNIMSDQSFNELYNLVKKEAFEDGKIKIISAAIPANLITTAQLTSLLKQFSFDERKLAAAKVAYPGIVDKQNFFKVAEIFDFSSNRDKLFDFIKTTATR